MNYYKELNSMYSSLERILKSQEISVDDLVYNLTKQFRVGEKAVIKRVELLKRLGYVEVDEATGWVKWKA